MNTIFAFDKTHAHTNQKEINQTNRREHNTRWEIRHVQARRFFFRNTKHRMFLSLPQAVERGFSNGVSSALFGHPRKHNPMKKRHNSHARTANTTMKKQQQSQTRPQPHQVEPTTLLSRPSPHVFSEEYSRTSWTCRAQLVGVSNTLAWASARGEQQRKPNSSNKKGEENIQIVPVDQVVNFGVTFEKTPRTGVARRTHSVQSGFNCPKCGDGAIVRLLLAGWRAQGHKDTRSRAWQGNKSERETQKSTPSFVDRQGSGRKNDDVAGTFSLVKINKLG